MILRTPRILIVTPEVSHLPQAMSSLGGHLNAKAGGLGDVSAALIQALYEQGADIHLAIPDYRTIFNHRLPPEKRRQLRTILSQIPDERVHLAVDRSFFYRDRVYSAHPEENLKMSIAFQREVINNIVPRVKPDLIHCNDWTTGLIPAMARKIGTPCLFTLHNLHTIRCTLRQIEDGGIDAAEFWEYLYYDTQPADYESARDHILVNFLASGIFGAHFINTVSAAFLSETAAGQHAFVEPAVRQEIAAKLQSGCATGILNAPAPDYCPSADTSLALRYGPQDHALGKRGNKIVLQDRLGLNRDGNAPLLFWPSRMDPVQKGCGLLMEILYAVVSEFWDENLQVVFVADGSDQRHVRDIVDFHGLQRRVSVNDFDEPLSRLAYAASDFLLMPSIFEPCGLPQMIGPKYGCLPIAHKTGGIRDSIRHLHRDGSTGNGFLFEFCDAAGLHWAIREAMEFYRRPAAVKAATIARIMRESAGRFNFHNTAQHYKELYETMLARPLLPMTENLLPFDLEKVPAETPMPLERQRIRRQTPMKRSPLFTVDKDREKVFATG